MESKNKWRIEKVSEQILIHSEQKHNLNLIICCRGSERNVTW